MTVSRSLVLITGATGHVGSSVLLHLLQAGYHVRAAVRSEAKAAAVLARPRIQWLSPGARLTFCIVPDITAPGAYDEAVEGATHVIHIASPLVTADRVPLRQHEAYFIQPAVRGTLNLLDAAHYAGTVRRVVITSSIVALVPCAQMEGTTARPPWEGPVRPSDRVAFEPGPYHSEFAAYAASKVASLFHAESWMKREHPLFDAVYLHPSFVLGHNDAVTSTSQALSGTNSIVLGMLLGKRYDAPFAGATVHVEDVARAHVLALDAAKVPGNQSYIFSRAATWADAKHIARREFPGSEGRLVNSGLGNVDTTEIDVDASLTEATFGFEHAPYEVQVKSTVKQFLELRHTRKPSVPLNPAKPVKIREITV